MALRSYDLIKQANSKETLRQFTPATLNSTLQKPANFQAILEMVDADTIATGAIQHFVDRFMEGDYAIIKRDSKEYDLAFEDKLFYEHDFEEAIIRRVVTLGKLFSNVFVEIVVNADGSLKDLNVLDTLNIEPVTKSNGDVLYYKSNIADPLTGEFPEWSEDKIIWFKFNNRTSGFGHVNLTSLWNNLRLKYHVTRFIDWCFATGQYRVVHNFKSNGDKVVNDFIAYNKKNEANFQAPFLIQGEYDVVMLRDMKEVENVQEFLKYLDANTLSVLRISPIDGGILDNSGRSSSDTQTGTTLTHIKSFKKTVTAGINRLFSKINKGNNAIVFAPSDKFEVSKLLENVQLMKASGFTDETIKEYLTDNGLVFKEKKLFNDIPDPTMDNPRDNDMAPSRLGKKEGEANKKVGTGKEGTTRQDQLVKQADTRKYWTYDVVVEDEK